MFCFAKKIICSYDSLIVDIPNALEHKQWNKKENVLQDKLGYRWNLNNDLVWYLWYLPAIQVKKLISKTWKSDNMSEIQIMIGKRLLSIIRVMI